MLTDRIWIIGEILSNLINLKVCPIEWKAPPGCCSTRYLFHVLVLLHNCLKYLLQVETVIVCTSARRSRLLLTKIVPWIVSEACSGRLLCEKHVISPLYSSPDSWELHFFWGDWDEFLIWSDVDISTNNWLAHIQRLYHIFKLGNSHLRHHSPFTIENMNLSEHFTIVEYVFWK